MNNFFLPIAKTEQAHVLLDKIHNNIHRDNNEKKTDRFSDTKISQTILFLINSNGEYYKHFRILIIPNNIKNRCTIVCDDNKQESLYLMPDNNDPENQTIGEIRELSYFDIKQKFIMLNYMYANV